MIYILLPVHNRLQTTALFISQLKAQVDQGFHLVVIDDGCKDGTPEMVRKELPSATVLRGEGNLWWGGSLQKGFEWVRENCLNPEDFILTVNDDTQFDPNFLKRAMEVLRDRSRTLLCAQCFGLQTGKLLDSGVFWNWSIAAMQLARFDGEINCFSTRGLFMRVGEFLELGGFHPKVLPHYFSDYEFTLRAYNRGFSMITDPTVRVATDEAAAGISEFNGTCFSGFLKQYFSKKNYRHPVYVFFFILFACPSWRLKVMNWIWLFREFMLALASALYRTCFSGRGGAKATS